MATRVRTEREIIPGDRVRALRESIGMTQERFALLVDVAVKTVSNFERRGVGRIEWAGITSICGMPIDWQPQAKEES